MLPPRYILMSAPERIFAITDTADITPCHDAVSYFAALRHTPFFTRHYARQLLIIAAILLHTHAIRAIIAYAITLRHYYEGLRLIRYVVITSASREIRDYCHYAMLHTPHTRHIITSLRLLPHAIRH